MLEEGGLAIPGVAAEHDESGLAALEGVEERFLERGLNVGRQSEVAVESAGFGVAPW